MPDILELPSTPPGAPPVATDIILLVRPPPPAAPAGTPGEPFAITLALLSASLGGLASQPPPVIGVPPSSSGTLTVSGTISDSNSAPYTDWPTIEPSAGGNYIVPAGTRLVELIVTVEGEVAIVSAGGNTAILPVGVGAQQLGGVPASFTTTATLTAYAFR